MGILDPLKLSKPIVCIVGMASSRDLLPWDRDDMEIWGINEAYSRKLRSIRNPNETFMKRWDRWFQMHPSWDCMRTTNFNHRNHPLWLANKEDVCMLCRGEGRKLDIKLVCPECGGSGIYKPSDDNRDKNGYPFPIYTLEELKDVPGSVSYPLADVIGCIGDGHDNARWFTSTFGYMVGLAILLGAKEIRSYGFEMRSDTEYAEQRPSAVFWLGAAIGRGVSVIVPPETGLLGHRDDLYGYEKVPGLSRMHAEIYVNDLKSRTLKAAGEASSISIQVSVLEAQIKNGRRLPKKEREILILQQEKMKRDRFDKLMEANALSGAWQQASKMLNEILLGPPRGDGIDYIAFDGKLRRGEDVK